jgi:diguanylate cyclase (GGDEF)-like protein
VIAINMMLMIQLDVFMILLLVSIAIHACGKLDRRVLANRLFIDLILLTISILTLEILSVVLNSPEFIVMAKIVNTAGFAIVPLLPILAMLYVHRKANPKQKISVKRFKWVMVPFLLNAILAIGSCQFGWIFSVTYENLYTRGPFFFISPLTSYFYYMIHFLVLYNNRNKINHEEMTALSLFSFIPAVLSVFQLYYVIYLTIWNSVAIAVAINYISILHGLSKRDLLTGLGNRVAYDEYLKNFNGKKHIVLGTVIMDLDNFKRVNDVFGHQAGDQALKTFAGQLELVFRGKGLAIRLGGDEFIVLLQENQRVVVEKYIQNLKKRLMDYNQSGVVPYDIQFSYGIAVFDASCHSIHDFIWESDKLMYQNKQNKRCQRESVST